jgi:ribosomal-protein-alanine N-acetyltransferase
VEEGVKVRAARRNEWQELWALEKECFPEGTSYTWPEFVESLQRCAFVLVAEGHLGIVGFLALETERDAAVVEDIAVDPNLQGAGIARRLVDAGIAALATRSEIRLLRLQVAKRNPNAVAAFEHLGFRTTRTLVGYYVSPAWKGDAFEMERAL